MDQKALRKESVPLLYCFLITVLGSSAIIILYPWEFYWKIVIPLFT